MSIDTCRVSIFTRAKMTLRLLVFHWREIFSCIFHIFSIFVDFPWSINYWGRDIVKASTRKVHFQLLFVVVSGFVLYILMFLDMYKLELSLLSGFNLSQLYMEKEGEVAAQTMGSSDPWALSDLESSASYARQSPCKPGQAHYPPSISIPSFIK